MSLDQQKRASVVIQTANDAGRITFAILGETAEDVRCDIAQCISDDKPWSGSVVVNELPIELVLPHETLRTANCIIIQDT